jgi:hypothetical protein
MLRGEATNTNLTVFGLTRWRWKPRIYSTRGEHSNHYTTDSDANPGSTAPEASTLTITPLKPRIYSTRDEHAIHYSTDGDGNPVSTAPEASTLTIAPSMVMETQDLQH